MMEEVTLRLNHRDVTVILTALDELAGKFGRPVWLKIDTQIGEQQKAHEMGKRILEQKYAAADAAAAAARAANGERSGQLPSSEYRKYDGHTELKLAAQGAGS